MLLLLWQNVRFRWQEWRNKGPFQVCDLDKINQWTQGVE